MMAPGMKTVKMHVQKMRQRLNRPVEITFVTGPRDNIFSEKFWEILERSEEDVLCDELLVVPNERIAEAVPIHRKRRRREAGA